VRHCSRPFIFSASIPPSSCAAALAALKFLRSHPEIVAKLAQISNYARAGFASRNIAVMQSEAPIIPIYMTDMVTTLTRAKQLFDAGVYVNSALPPATPPNGCLLRTSYMATHTEALIDEALDIIKAVLETKEHD